MRATFAMGAIILAAASAAAVPTLDLPPRPADAATGTEFYNQISSPSLTREAREDIICDEIASGNIPPFMRNLKTVTVNRTINGTPRTGTMYVTPDYLGVGTDDDFFRLPMTPILAQRLADITGTHLTTRQMVNDIYAAADRKIAPSTIAPSPAMTTVPVFWDHNVAVEAQLSAAGALRSQLVGGNKKDVIISIRLHNGFYTTPRVIIYGWHQLNGTAIQPLSGVHEDTYADYSHGIRLVHAEVLVDGAERTLTDVINDPAVAALFNDEGVYTPARYPYPKVATFPLVDSFPASGRELDSWTNRFVAPTLVSFSPTSPEGDGTVLVVKDPSGGADTTRIGDSKAKDYFVQAHIYCQMRTDVAANGFERVGIFLRDDGNGLFEGTNGAGTIRANNYCLTFDSNDGRVRCIRTVDGVPTDMLPAPVLRPTTQWRLMRIEAEGTQLRFLLDGELLLETTDATHAMGQCGIGFREFFATNSNLQGTRADNFMADALPAAQDAEGHLWGCY